MDSVHFKTKLEIYHEELTVKCKLLIFSYFEVIDSFGELICSLATKQISLDAVFDSGKFLYYITLGKFESFHHCQQIKEPVEQ